MGFHKYGDLPGFILMDDKDETSFLLVFTNTVICQKFSKSINGYIGGNSTFLSKPPEPNLQ
jgi:hypothetical protein